jgi:energy-converting hydrogenase Eha subunit A
VPDAPRAKTKVVSAVPPVQTNQQERKSMTLSIAHLQPIVSLIAGVLILMMPRLLNYIVAFFLIVSGILGLGLIH